MKKILIVALTLMTATSMFALPPPKTSAPKHGGGPCLIPPIRKDAFRPNEGGVSKSPNAAMANAVAISGFAAMGARFVQEMITPPKDIVIVFPEGVETPIVIKEQPPIVEHPVPISPLPMEIMKSK